MTDGYVFAKLGDLEIPRAGADGVWAMVRHHFGIQSYGVNAWGADEAGQEVIQEHDESSSGGGHHEELYVVLSGRATFTVDGETVDASAGTLVFVRDPEVKRKAVAEEPGTRVLAFGARRGEPFVPSQWERSAPVLELFAAGEIERARDLLRELVEQYPEDHVQLYNLACAESRLGRTDEALAYLRRAIEGGERFADLARTDTDLDAIRDDPRFRELVDAG